MWWEIVQDLSDLLRQQHSVEVEIVKGQDFWNVHVLNTPHSFYGLEGDSVVNLLNGILVGLEAAGV